MDVSIIEFAVYAFFSYSSVLMLIISVIKEMPVSRSLSIIRSFFMTVGMVASAMLAGVGVHINGFSQVVNTITRNATGSIITNATQTFQPQQITLIQPFWITFHYLLFVVLLVYVIIQAITLLTKND